MTDTLGVAARGVFLTWELRLRPAYNLILAAIAGCVVLRLSSMGYPVPRNPRTVFHFVTRAIAANVLFTAGPLADLYISTLLGRRSFWVTGLIFTLGTLVSVMIVPISVSWFWSRSYPNFAGSD